MDKVTELLGRVLDIQAETLGRPAAIDTRHIRRPDGTVNAEYYGMAVRASIADGICPWDGSGLTPGRQCHHPVHGNNGITWTPWGDIIERLPLPEITEIDERPSRITYDKLADIDEATIRALQDWDRRLR